MKKLTAKQFKVGAAKMKAELEVLAGKELTGPELIAKLKETVKAGLTKPQDVLKAISGKAKPKPKVGGGKKVKALEAPSHANKDYACYWDLTDEKPVYTGQKAPVGATPKETIDLRMAVLNKAFPKLKTETKIFIWHMAKDTKDTKSFAHDVNKMDNTPYTWFRFSKATTLCGLEKKDFFFKLAGLGYGVTTSNPGPCGYDWLTTDKGLPSNGKGGVGAGEDYVKSAKL